MTGSALLSVLLPVHNGEQFLRQALESLSSQTFTDYELIVINDGSTDATQEILSDYQSRDPRVRIYSQARSGIVASLNRAIAQSSGDYAARMDADDIAFPDRFDRQLKVLRDHPEIGVLGGAAVVIDAAGREIGSLQYPTDDRGIRAALRLTNPFCHPTAMMRMALLKDVGGYRAAFPHAEDFDLWLRVSEQSRMRNLAEPLLYYRWHAGQVSARELKQQLVEVVGARVSAKMRRAGLRDPLAQSAPVSLDLLQTLGVSEREVQSQLLSEVATRSTVLVTLRQPAQAQRLLEEGLVEADILKVHRRVQAQVGIAFARAAFGRGATADGLLWLVKAVWAHPEHVVRTLGRGASELVRRRAIVRP
jgi:GT2 family glycosyltransferase